MSQAPSGFGDLGLEPRLLRALEKKGYAAPTPVQAEAVPKALQGKDVVARARTGSGKTLAYLLPAFHRLLSSGNAMEGSFQALVLVPTSELREQVREEAHALAVHCAAGMRVTAIGNESTDQARKVAMGSAGHVVVSTPSRVAAALQDRTLTPAHLAKQLQVLVMDEADLLLSFGYQADLQIVAAAVPRRCQCILMSATTSDDVTYLSKLILHNPSTLDLTHLPSAPSGGAAAEVEHSYVTVAPQDRLLAVLTLLRLNLVKRKVLLFVNTVDTAYRVRLLLEAFGLKAAVLNASLPLNSRQHIIEQFNRDLFDHLIATDGPAPAAASDGKASGRVAGSSKGDPGRGAATASGGKRARRTAQDAAEFGAARGIDFKNVRTVVNVERPEDVASYTHRVGRTGRAGSSGLAVTLCTDADEPFLSTLRSALGETVVGAPESTSSSVLSPLKRLRPAALDALRYRGEDVLKSLTKSVVRAAQARDLKLEILNSSRLQDLATDMADPFGTSDDVSIFFSSSTLLQTFLEAHEADAKVLRHDKTLSQAPQRTRHLRQLPDYLKASAGLPARGHRQGVVRRAAKRKLRPDDDPIKGKVLFTKEDAPTAMEERAMKYARKAARKAEKKGAPTAVPKRNVRKRR